MCSSDLLDTSYSSNSAKEKRSRSHRLVMSYRRWFHTKNVSNIQYYSASYVYARVNPIILAKFTNANYSGTDTQKEIHFYLCALASKNFCTKDFERVAKQYFAIEKEGKTLESPELRKFIEDRMKKVEEIEKVLAMTEQSRSYCAD